MQPDVPESAAEPLAYVSARIGNDSVHYAAGVNSYVGVAWVADTSSSRYFCFYLYNELIPVPKQCFKIYVNNAEMYSGIPVQDLDSTIVSDTLYYQDYTNSFYPSAVTIAWYDSAGTEYSTRMISQPNNFVITSVEDISHDNRMYKKVTVEFNCYLADSNWNIIPLTNGRATLLFGLN